MNPKPVPPPLSAPADLLRAKYLERRERNPAYSSRAFARDLGISQAMLSLVWNRKRSLSMKQAVKVSAALNLEETESKDLFRSLFGASKRPSVESALAPRVLEAEHLQAISRWYPIAILDLSTTQGFRDDPSWIAGRLGITKLEAEDARSRLLRLGLLRMTPKGAVKSNEHLRFDSPVALPAVRAFHRQMIGKATEALEETSSEAHQRRKISGYTLAIDPTRLDAAKKRIAAFELEMAEFLTKGPSSEVYQLNIQFFPLTHPLKPKKAKSI